MIKLFYKTTAALIITAVLFFARPTQARRQMENLGRGVVAVNQGDGKIFVGWRMLGTDPDDVAFNLYLTTDCRFYTLMHDPIYRLSATWHNGAYNKPTQPGFYFGEGMAAPPHPDIVLVGIDN